MKICPMVNTLPSPLALILFLLKETLILSSNNKKRFSINNKMNKRKRLIPAKNL